MFFNISPFSRFSLLHRRDKIKQNTGGLAEQGQGRAVFFPKFNAERRMNKRLQRNLDRFERLSSYGGVPRVRHNSSQILILYAERKRGLCGVAVARYWQGVKLTGVVAT